MIEEAYITSKRHGFNCSLTSFPVNSYNALVLKRVVSGYNGNCIAPYVVTIDFSSF